MDFYLDTCIWLDLIEERGTNGIKAKQFIKFVVQNNHVIFYSDLTMLELRKRGYNLISILKIVKNIIIRHVHIYPEHVKYARILSKKRNIPNKDALHATIAKDNHSYMVSRDKHFQIIWGLIQTYLPEDFL